MSSTLTCLGRLKQKSQVGVQRRDSGVVCLCCKSSSVHCCLLIECASMMNAAKPRLCLAGVHASDDGADVACPVSLIDWFLSFYKATQQGPVQPLEGICRAGEVLFVPRGWWHMALNVEVCCWPSLCSLSCVSFFPAFCCAVLCMTESCCAVLCCAVLCCAVLCSIGLS